MSGNYDVFFRGDIAPGHQMVEVRERLQTIFKLDNERAAKLFSGRPMAIRRGLDEASAETYRETLLKAGALVELRPSENNDSKNTTSSNTKIEQPSSETSADTSVSASTSKTEAEASDTAEISESPEETLSLAPAGTDVLKPEERIIVDAVEVDTSGLDVDPVGVDLLNEEEKKVIEDLDIDLSHLSVDPLDN